jgi:hypothetical protein
MLIVRSHGQLGNQIFHLLGALTVLRAKERLILFGFGELVELLPNLKSGHLVIPIPNRFSRNLKFLERGLRRLARRGLIGRANYGPEPGDLVRTGGRLSPTLFDAGNAQNYSVINERVRSDFFQRLERELKLPPRHSGDNKADLRCFVHIRRGDYLSHPSAEESIAIPDLWFLERMTLIAKQHPQVKFFLYSDDASSLSEEILSFRNIQVRRVDHITAFREMALADMGILSASTFSWWSAMLADHRGAPGPFIGPKYWVGWRKGVWEPEGCISEALTYVDVKC